MSGGILGRLVSCGVCRVVWDLLALWFQAVSRFGYPPGFRIKIFEKDTDKYIMAYQAEGCAGLTLLVG